MGVFSLSYKELPDHIPIFPLGGTILLPNGEIPLNIFEPRYIQMIKDVLLTDSRVMGIIMPRDNEAFQNELAKGNGEKTPVFSVGAAGRITAFTETEDGRYLIALEGVCRFRIQALVLDEDIPYRMIKANWCEFKGDFKKNPPLEFDRKKLMELLKGFFKLHDYNADWTMYQETPDERLITALSMICPFKDSEKQALLEVKTVNQRATMLMQLIEMAVMGGNSDLTMKH